jgi:DnaJ domain
MAPNADPWRTLGLTPGATQDEIRRAYRRLAKVNHPDAAGDAALPRFLAIQQAYDQLAGPGAIRRAVGRPATRPAASGDPREPWRADPDRARASARADGRRTPGARPGGPGRRPDGADGSTDGGPARPSAAPGSTWTGGGPGSAPGGRSRRSSGRRRPVNRATPGSTSYEGADEEPFEPGWSGATWYGASSGTYWTINPKEYADPRKHGPEYQARARRSTGGGQAPDEGEPIGPPDEGVAEEPALGRTAAGPSPGTAGRSRAGSRPSARSDWSGGFTAGVEDASPPPSTSAAGGPPAADAPPSPRWDRAAGDVPPRRPPLSSLRDAIEEPPPGRLPLPLLREPTTPIGRLAMAALGWPPLGMFVAAAVDESTGCGRYAASCADVASPGTWLLNAMLLLFLLALPRVATWSAHGTIAALVAGIPTAIALSAGGGSNVPEASGPVLMTVLALAYLAGVGYAIVRRLQLGGTREPAGRRVP